MKKLICRVLSLVMMATMVFQLSACSSEWNEQKAQQYVEAVLSLVCTGENNTGVEFSDLSSEDYASERQKIIDAFVENAGLSSYGVSDEIIDSFAKVVDKAMTKVTYDVGTATKTDNGFTVPVTIHPLLLLDGIDTTALQNKVIDMVESGEIDASDTTAIYDKVYELLIEEMDKNLDNPSYGEDHEMTFDVTKDSNGNYSASEENGEEFGSYMFALS